VSCDAQPHTHSPTRTATTPDHTTPTSTSHVEVDVATSLRLRRRRCRAPLISSRISPHTTAVSCAHVRVDGWSAVEGRIRVRLKSAAWAWAWGGVMERSPSGWGCGARACAGVPDAGWASGRPASAAQTHKNRWKSGLNIMIWALWVVYSSPPTLHCHGAVAWPCGGAQAPLKVLVENGRPVCLAYCHRRSWYAALWQGWGLAVVLAPPMLF